jgi:hypothetical protein
MEELSMQRVAKICRVKPSSLKERQYLKIVTRILGLWLAWFFVSHSDVYFHFIHDCARSIAMSFKQQFFLCQCVMYFRSMCTDR